MKPLFQFQGKKFKGLTQKLQHKNCFELLREAFHNTSKRIELLNEYKNLLNLMELNLKAPVTEEELQDHFHFHREKANVSVKEHNFLTAVKTQDQESSVPFLSIDIYLDKLRSTHNIGSIIRTVEAFRLGEVFFSAGMAEPDHEQVKKSSMGASDWVKTHKNRELETLKRPIIALETCPTSPTYYDFVYPDSFTLAVGNEEKGLSENTLSIADHIIHIPLFGKKNSINVSQAFAICASEIVRQKQKKTIL
jgi:tRNA G18 (ribose-2'-O)-methylase SpoU